MQGRHIRLILVTLLASLAYFLAKWFWGSLSYGGADIVGAVTFSFIIMWATRAGTFRAFSGLLIFASNWLSAIAFGGLAATVRPENVREATGLYGIIILVLLIGLPQLIYDMTKAPEWHRISGIEVWWLSLLVSASSATGIGGSMTLVALLPLLAAILVPLIFSRTPFKESHLGS